MGLIAQFSNQNFLVVHNEFYHAFYLAFLAKTQLKQALQDNLPNVLV